MIWIALILGGLITYFTRASFLAAGTAVELPSWLKRALPFVAPAVFAAMVAPIVLGDEGLSGLSTPRPEVLAAALSALAVWKTKNLGLGLLVGMLALWGLRFLGL